MSDFVEKTVGGANIPAWQLGLANAVNETYSYATNTIFYALIPNFMRTFYWRQIKPACEWLDGYVPALHSNGASGIISTRIGNRLISGLTKTIVGEQLRFKLNDDSNDKDAVLFISKLADKMNYKKSLYSVSGFALANGTALLKINKTLGGDLWLEASRIDQCYFDATPSGEVNRATFLIKGYTNTTSQKERQYFLVEERYYVIHKAEVIKKSDGTFEVLWKEGEKEPKVVYKFYEVTGTLTNNVMSANTLSQSRKWSEVPQNVRDQFKNDYSILRVDEAQTLPFTNLGVYLVRHGEMDLGVPQAQNYGASLLIPIQDELITYELASAYRIRDMYLGKGTLLVPKNLSMSDFADKQATGGVLSSNIGETPIEFSTGLDPDKQKPVVQQFDVREDTWQKIQDDCIKRIATKWNMSPKIISSYLVNGVAQMTATQIDSEDDVAIAFINNTRAELLDVFNKVIEDIMNYYGKPANINIQFSTPSLINKDRIIERVIKKLDNGLIDFDDAMKEVYTDLDDEELQAKIEKTKPLYEEARAKKQEMNFDGTFTADDYDDLGGTNANGTTETDQ